MAFIHGVRLERDVFFSLYSSLFPVFLAARCSPLASHFTSCEATAFSSLGWSVLRVPHATTRNSRSSWLLQAVCHANNCEITWP